MKLTSIKLKQELIKIKFLENKVAMICCQKDLIHLRSYEWDLEVVLQQWTLLIHIIKVDKVSSEVWDLQEGGDNKHSHPIEIY